MRNSSASWWVDSSFFFPLDCELNFPNIADVQDQKLATAQGETSALETERNALKIALEEAEKKIVALEELKKKAVLEKRLSKGRVADIVNQFEKE